MPDRSAYTPPPTEVVSFLQRVFDFADSLEPSEGVALRRLIRAGLMADDGTIEAVLTSDVSGYIDATLPPPDMTRPTWFWMPES